MKKHGKKYVDAAKKAPQGAVSVAEAVAFVKANAFAKFDESVELGMRMGCDPRKSDQMIRGTVSLPHGTGKDVRVVVFAGGAAAEAAKAAGAIEAGTDELLEKIKGGWMDFDVAIATPEAMTAVRKLARVLGPRGLMQKAGKVEFRMDRQGNICVLVGKRSFDADKLAANIEALVEAIRAARPAAVKGQLFKKISVSSTMGVPVRLDIRD